MAEAVAAAAGEPRSPGPKEPFATEVAEWISEGKTLRDYCRQPGKPKRRTIDDWRAADPEFAARIARARDDGFDVIAEECMAIADTPMAGTTTTVDDSEKGGTKTVTEDMLGHRKLQVETRLKLLAKWDPRRYGDKPDIGDGNDDVEKFRAVVAAIMGRRAKKVPPAAGADASP